MGHLCAWLRAHNVPEEDDMTDTESTSAVKARTRHNILLLALERDSVAQRYLLARPLHVRTSWLGSIAVLQEYFASPARLEMVSLYVRLSACLACLIPSLALYVVLLSDTFLGRQRRQAAINALYTRAFRDDSHRGESVQDLITDFEKLALQAGLTEQQCMQMFSW